MIQMEPGRALVTGAAGFLGSSLTDRLLSLGWTVTGVDNFAPTYDASVKRANLLSASSHPSFTLVECDVCDPVGLASVQGQFDVIVHLAARGGVRPSIAHPTDYVRTNLVGTSVMLEWARDRGVRAFVFASSSSVYGRRTAGPFCEDDPGDPVSPYAATKRAGELLCHAASEVGDLSVACLRFFTVYGPRQRPDMAIHTFARGLLEGRTITLFGDGGSSRDYTYVDDVLAAMVAAIERVRVGTGGCEVINIGTGRVVRLDQVVALLAQHMSVSPHVEYERDQPGDVPTTCADIDRARRLLGYEPRVTIEEGIPRFVEWLRRRS